MWSIGIEVERTEVNPRATAHLLVDVEVGTLPLVVYAVEGIVNALLYRRITDVDGVASCLVYLRCIDGGTGIGTFRRQDLTRRTLFEGIEAVADAAVRHRKALGTCISPVVGVVCLLITA